jgi:lipid-A-disaccharide synthase
MKLAVVAGEASGDLHASEVIRELKLLDPSLETFGIGGDLLARQGMQILQHAREMGIVGLFNVIRQLGMLNRVFRELVARIAAERPDAVLLIDYPDFNLRVARKAKALGIPVIYYISPQVWAWRRGRVRQIGQCVDRMIVLFPFEEEFYRQHHVPVTYVGHPLIEQLRDVKRQVPSGSRIRVALLPGSRKSEVEDLLPPMLEAVRLIDDAEAFVVLAPTIDRKQLEAIM